MLSQAKVKLPQSQFEHKLTCVNSNLWLYEYVGMYVWMSVGKMPVSLWGRMVKCLKKTHIQTHLLKYKRTIIQALHCIHEIWNLYVYVCLWVLNYGLYSVIYICEWFFEKIWSKLTLTQILVHSCTHILSIYMYICTYIFRYVHL